jgi:tetratricopeptide (TPR) repeat protein
VNIRGRAISSICILGLVAFLAGCGPGKAYRTGRRAEKHGAAHKAYDAYCRAAREHPGNGTVAAGIKRAVPAAAAFWEAQAKAAANEGHYADAWRMWMRTLDIRPDHPTAPAVIRQLQEQYPSAVADARADWLRRGSASLALAEPRDLLARANAAEQGPRGRTPDQPDSPPAKRAEALAMAANPPDVEADLAGRAGLADPDPPEDEDESDPASQSKPADARRPPEEATQPPQAPSWEIDPQRVAAVEPGQAAEPEPQPETDKPPPTEGARARQGLSAAIARAVSNADALRKPSQQGDGASARRGPRHEDAQPDAAPAGEKRSRPVGEFLVVRTLSKKDRRYPKQAKIIDGITVRLRDTDGDLDADLNLYDGDRRIKKIRELPIGRSQTFRGHSGKRYRLTILSIHHKSHTVRIGIKPA